MKLNNKGVSMAALVITIIVVVLIASITINYGFVNVDKAQQVVFLTELESAHDAINIYNERASLYGSKSYNKNRLSWDGKSGHLNNSAKLDYFTNDSEGKKINPKYPTDDQRQKIQDAPEDTPQFVFDGEIPNSLKGKIYIYEGQLGVYKENQLELEWASQKYNNMSESRFSSPSEFE